MYPRLPSLAHFHQDQRQALHGSVQHVTVSQCSMCTRCSHIHCYMHCMLFELVQFALMVCFLITIFALAFFSIALSDSVLLSWLIIFLSSQLSATVECRSPSPYRARRGSPDYGRRSPPRRRSRDSPDYGRYSPGR